MTHRLVIAYAANRLRLLPPDAPRFHQTLRQRIRGPYVIHVSRRWISVKAFTHDRSMVAKAIEALGGDVLFIRTGEPPVCGSRLLDTYLGYLAANMFWEAHVAGEEVWRRAGLVGRAMAAAAGALAKTQEGLPEAAARLVEKAASFAAGAGAVLDVERGLELVREVYREGWAHGVPEWLRPLAEAARADLGTP